MYDYEISNSNENVNICKNELTTTYSAPDAKIVNN